MAIIAIIIGVVLIIYPATTLSMVIISIGALLLISSASSIVDYFKLKGRSLKPSQTMLFNGGVSAIVGIVLIMSPLFFIGFLLSILSVLLLLGSLSQIISLVYAKNKGVIMPAYVFIVPLLLFILSIVMLTMSPEKMAVELTIMFGYGIVIYSVMELISYYRLRNL